jgi:hypothetical protein
MTTNAIILAQQGDLPSLMQAASLRYSRQHVCATSAQLQPGTQPSAANAQLATGAQPRSAGFQPAVSPTCSRQTVGPFLPKDVRRPPLATNPRTQLGELNSGAFGDATHLKPNFLNTPDQIIFPDFGFRNSDLA